MRGMEPGERVSLIHAITTTFEQNDMSWELIGVALDKFGGDEGFHGVGPQHTLHRVASLPDDMLIALHAYLHPDEAADKPLPQSDDGGPWMPDHFRLFISHTSAHQKDAGAIRSHMARVGIDAFVAHTTIEPTAKWEDMILRGLQTCHALVALLTEDFPKSNWCDQEVGVAVSRGILVVPVRMGLDPYGFIGSIQGLTTKPEYFLPRQLFELLAGHALTKTRMVDPVIWLFARSTSFDATRVAWTHVKALPPEAWTAERVRIVRDAVKTNSQVRNCNLPDRDQTPVPRALEDNFTRLGVIDDGDILF